MSAISVNSDTVNLRINWKNVIRKLQVYVVARGSRLLFFKDQKASKAVPEATFRGEPPLVLEGAAIQIANDYTKKKNVFRIKWVSSPMIPIRVYSDS